MAEAEAGTDPASDPAAVRPLAGQTALVAGGSGNIGSAVAVALAAAGADVAITYRSNADRAAAVAAEVRAGGRRCRTVQTDLRRRSDAERAVASAAGDLGPVSIFVWAVRAGAPAFFRHQDPSEWDGAWETDLRALFHCCQAVLEPMVERRSGRIVFVSSDSGRVGQLGAAVSSAFRGAINAFAKSLARELARDGITVNAVCAGPTRGTTLSGLQGAPSAHVWRRLVDRIPLKRPAEPREIASLVAYLASGDAGYITGQVMSVSGGLTMV